MSFMVPVEKYVTAIEKGMMCSSKMTAEPDLGAEADEGGQRRQKGDVAPAPVTPSRRTHYNNNSNYSA